MDNDILYVLVPVPYCSSGLLSSLLLVWDTYGALMLLLYTYWPMYNLLKGMYQARRD